MEVNTAKAISMLALGLGSFVAGMLPAFISEDARRRHPLLISCLLCFGAGVLLSTSLVHMLPEARVNYPNNSEFMFCLGFFLVYLVDEIVHLFYRVEEHRQGNNYGSREETRLLRNDENGETEGRCRGDTGDAGMCHVSHTPPCSRTSSGTIGLLSALFVHSLLEGLAIGLQESTAQVLLLLGAVSAHKYVVGFCLGAELCATAPTVCRHLVCVLIFSVGSVAGIALGAGLESVTELQDSVAVPIMQALAAGTLLYVTVSEVLPRERAHWHEKRRHAGSLQFISVGIGFLLMYFSTKYLDHDGV